MQTGKPPIATLLGMHEVTPRTIAYTAVLVSVPPSTRNYILTLLSTQCRFVLNSQHSWSARDGRFSGPEFFRSVLRLFKNEAWSVQTLAWWNKYVPLSLIT